MKNMRGSGLTEGDAPMPSSDALAKLNQPLAREHSAHISGNNKMETYTTSKPSLGTLGARNKGGK